MEWTTGPGAQLPWSSGQAALPRANRAGCPGKPPVGDEALRPAPRAASGGAASAWLGSQLLADPALRCREGPSGSPGLWLLVGVVLF